MLETCIEEDVKDAISKLINSKDDSIDINFTDKEKFYEDFIALLEKYKSVACNTIGDVVKNAYKKRNLEWEDSEWDDGLSISIWKVKEEVA